MIPLAYSQKKQYLCSRKFLDGHMKRILGIVLCLALALPMMAQEETLCMDGTLLFREDFGGNDPSDPVAGTDPVPGMTSSYMQIYDTAHCNGRPGCRGMGSGRYLVTKVGYRNSRGYNYSHWFIMDDHTYPNDYSRGYLLEIDGRTDGATIYETIIDGLCEGSRLTFTAYAVNVTTAHSYDVDRNNGDPQLSFVLADPETGSEITTPYNTGPIPVDRSYKGMPGEWRNSAHWNLVGMNFTVPPGRTAIKLIIKNACMQSNGNDFAIDDIEIRLCAPPVTIEGEAEVCTNTSTTLTANFTNDGTFAEPLAYKWWHSADSVTWTEMSDFNGEILTFSTIQKADSGWYKVAVSGDGNIESVNCRAMSEPFRLRVNECEPPEPPTPPTPDTIRTDTTVCDTIDQIAWRGKEFVLADTLRDTVYSHCGFDSIYYELHVTTEHCEPPVPPCPELITITADTMVCDTLMPYRWRDTLFTEPATYEILYKNELGCDSLLRVLTLNTQICCPKMVTITVDTVVCDTLMPYRWRDTLFTEPATYEILYKNELGCDSMLRVLTLGTQVCCPNVVTITADTTVCDTLMPFTWTIGGQTFVFEQVETQEREMPHPKWTECTGTNYVLRLDTFHCEKLWLIIVNKYDWQLLCNNVALRNYFPAQTATAFQWYKNEQAIPGATGDDYSEHNELQGVFQLNVHLNDGRSIWSNIIEIDGPKEAPARVQIYNSQGMPVSEGQMTRGVYLYRYEKGKEVWTEKKIVL